MVFQAMPLKVSKRVLQEHGKLVRRTQRPVSVLKPPAEEDTFEFMETYGLVGWNSTHNRKTESSYMCQ